MAESMRFDDAGWIGAAGPGPSYLDDGSGGPDAGCRFDHENPEHR